jgi:hypothetical protein
LRIKVVDKKRRQHIMTPQKNHFCQQV